MHFSEEKRSPAIFEPFRCCVFTIETQGKFIQPITNSVLNDPNKQSNCLQAAARIDLSEDERLVQTCYGLRSVYRL